MNVWTIFNGKPKLWEELTQGCKKWVPFIAGLTKPLYLSCLLSFLEMIWTKMSRCSLAHCSLSFLKIMWLPVIVPKFVCMCVCCSGKSILLCVCMTLSVFLNPCLSQTPEQNNAFIIKGQYRSLSQASFLNIFPPLWVYKSHTKLQQCVWGRKKTLKTSYED